MEAPAIRNLNSLVAEIGKSVAPQKALIDQDISALERSGAAQEAGLKATAQKEYGAIEQRASDKGMFFSGFSPDEQANYNATTFLPSLARLQETIASTRSQLLGRKADIDTDVFNKAFGTREGDVDRKFTFEQAEVERRFTSAENEKDRAQARKLQAMQAAASAPKGPSTAQVVGSIVSELQTVAGKDGYVSPKSYNDARQAWVALGGKPGDFDGTFRGFANPTHINDYLASGI